MAKREIHNGHDLWAELLQVLLSGPNLGMCSRKADPGGLQGHLCPRGREAVEVRGAGGGAQWGRHQPRRRRYRSQVEEVARRETALSGGTSIG